MANTLASPPTGVAVTCRSYGRGTTVTTFAGTDRAAVLAAALDFRAKQDEWLQPTYPSTYAGPEGVWRADVTVFSAE